MQPCRYHKWRIKLASLFDALTVARDLGTVSL